MKSTDVTVIGGGFYGLRIALYLREEVGVDRVTVLERESELMSRASLVNQARVHNGYHYPRSILTAFRSRVNFPIFIEEYAPAIVDDFDHHYAIASHLSKVSAKQFELFCKRIGAEYKQARPNVASLFRRDLVGGVYTVREYGFDSHKLRDLLEQRLRAVGGVDIRTGIEVEKVETRGSELVVVTGTGALQTDRVINATYSGLNEINSNSGLEQFHLQHEVTEMALIDVPADLKKTAFTVMDGPFFSIMPYPTRDLHTLSHVRYTPHRRWRDGAVELSSQDSGVDRDLRDESRSSTFQRMRADVERYIPSLAAARHVDSIYEIKTVPVKSNDSDSRPILYRTDPGMPGYSSVLGGKLDNIYDVFRELDRDYA